MKHIAGTRIADPVWERSFSVVDGCIQLILRVPEIHAKVHEDYRRALVRRFPYEELRTAFNSVDYVAPDTIFDISGNKFRLIARVDYALKTVLVKKIMIHSGILVPGGCSPPAEGDEQLREPSAGGR